jgi:hypothetical protein
VRLTVDGDIDSPWQKAPVALTIENARNIKLIDFEITWAEPSQPHWQSAVVVDNTQDLLLDGLSVRQAPTGTAASAVVLNNVDGAMVRHSRAQAETGTFLHVTGSEAREIVLGRNDLCQAKTPWDAGEGARKDAVREEIG